MKGFWRCRPIPMVEFERGKRTIPLVPSIRVLASPLARGVAGLFAVAWTVGGVGGAPAAGPASQDTTDLAPDRTIDRELTRGQEQRYRLALAAGEWVRVIVE